MKAPKEFEELSDAQMYISDSMMNDYSDRGLIDAVNRAKKDAWNAAIKWAAFNVKVEYVEAERSTTGNYYDIDKKSILNGLIED